MKPIKSVLAGLAAAGLVFSQAAVAAPHRTGSATTESEQFAGFPGAAIPALIAIVAVVAVAVISSSNDNDNDNRPVSP